MTTRIDDIGENEKLHNSIQFNMSKRQPLAVFFDAYNPCYFEAVCCELWQSSLILDYIAIAKVLLKYVFRVTVTKFTFQPEKRNSI